MVVCALFNPIIWLGLIPAFVAPLGAALPRGKRGQSPMESHNRATTDDANGDHSNSRRGCDDRR